MERDQWRLFRVPQPLQKDTGLNLSVIGDTNTTDADLYVSEVLPRSVFDFTRVVGASGDKVRVVPARMWGVPWRGQCTGTQPPHSSMPPLRRASCSGIARSPAASGSASMPSQPAPTAWGRAARSCLTTTRRSPSWRRSGPATPPPLRPVQLSRSPAPALARAAVQVGHHDAGGQRHAVCGRHRARGHLPGLLLATVLIPARQAADAGDGALCVRQHGLLAPAAPLRPPYPRRAPVPRTPADRGSGDDGGGGWRRGEAELGVQPHGWPLQRRCQRRPRHPRSAACARSVAAAWRAAADPVDCPGHRRRASSAAVAAPASAATAAAAVPEPAAPATGLSRQQQRAGWPASRAADLCRAGLGPAVDGGPAPGPTVVGSLTATWSAIGPTVRCTHTRTLAGPPELPLELGQLVSSGGGEGGQAGEPLAPGDLAVLRQGPSGQCHARNRGKQSWRMPGRRCGTHLVHVETGQDVPRLEAHVGQSVLMSHAPLNVPSRDVAVCAAEQ